MEVSSPTPSQAFHPPILRAALFKYAVNNLSYIDREAALCKAAVLRRPGGTREAGFRCWHVDLNLDFGGSANEVHVLTAGQAGHLFAKTWNFFPE